MASEEGKFDSRVKKEVVVIGGGPAGSVAAIAAARNGAETLLVERFQYLGGMMTGGLVVAIHGMRIHKDRMTTDAYQYISYRTEQVIKGIPQEIHDRLIKLGGAYGHVGEASNKYLSDPEIMKYLLDQMMEEARVELWLQSLATDAIVKDGKIIGVVVENKSGRHLIEAGVVVDASGDADIAAKAGAPYEKGDKEIGRTMPVSLVFVMGGVDLSRTIQYLKENPEELEQGKIEKWEELYKQDNPIELIGFRKKIGEAYEKGDFPLAQGAKNPTPLFALSTMFRMGKVIHDETVHVVDMAYDVDATDAKDLTKALLHTRKQALAIANFLKKYVPGYESSYLKETASQLGIRESRRIIGEYVLTAEDVLEGRKFEDVIARCGRAMNVHSVIGGKEGEKRGGGIWLETKSPSGYDIPFRCLLPVGVDNLLVAGRCISVDHLALGSVRGEPACMAIGQAAGTAAAMAAKLRIVPRRLDIKKLQLKLIEQGVNLGRG